MRIHRLFTRVASIGLVAGVAFGCLPYANAQFGGTTGTSAFGTRTLGGSSTANRTGRSTGASNSPLANSGIGQSQSGGQGQGAAGPGTSGNTVTGSERYVRGNQKGSFVGADSSDATNPFSQAAAGGAM